MLLEISLSLYWSRSRIEDGELDDDLDELDLMMSFCIRQLKMRTIRDNEDH